jgi:hypothetical protein
LKIIIFVGQFYYLCFYTKGTIMDYYSFRNSVFLACLFPSFTHTYILSLSLLSLSLSLSPLCLSLFLHHFSLCLMHFLSICFGIDFVVFIIYYTFFSSSIQCMSVFPFSYLSNFSTNNYVSLLEDTFYKIVLIRFGVV